MMKKVESRKIDPLSITPNYIQITTEGQEFKVISTDYSETRGEYKGKFKQIVSIGVDENLECSVKKEIN